MKRGFMTEQTIKTRIDKICQESECAEKMNGLDQGQQDLFKSFTYCPYCAEEMTLACHSCHEQLLSGDFKYCPWCGAEFEE